MTVRELIDELECLNEDAEIVIQVSNSSYPESIRAISYQTIRSFYGNDIEAYIIKGDEQIGMV